jgi:hypothetical protein
VKDVLRIAENVYVETIRWMTTEIQRICSDPVRWIFIFILIVTFYLGTFFGETFELYLDFLRAV